MAQLQEEEFREKRAIAMRLQAENQLAAFDMAISAARKAARAKSAPSKKPVRR